MSSALHGSHVSSASIFSFGLRAIRMAMRAVQHRQAALHLAAMSDTELKDIGLSRAEIGFAVRNGRPDPAAVSAWVAACETEAPELRGTADRKVFAEQRRFRPQRQPMIRPTLRSEVSRP